MAWVSKALHDAEVTALRREIDIMRAAVNIAKAETEERFKGTNEWRQTVEGLQKNFVTKEQIRWTFMAVIAFGTLTLGAIAIINWN